MQNRTRFRTPLAVLCTAVLALGSSTVAFAQHGGGGHAMGGGGGHAGGGRGYAGGGYRGGYGGGYGYRGGYGGYGYRGGYGWRGGYYGGWGWGWGLGGLGLGLYFASLPLYYSTYYWGGIPYYYADNTYYTYDPNVAQYVTVAPPAGLVDQSGAPAALGAPGPAGGAGTDLMAYPKNGQTEEQQKQDKYECHHWASVQSGFDPTQGSAASPSAEKRSDYMRAQTACLEGRGYSVK